jgi:dTDP-4-dehydrorhamnose 3,5-epimerase-like enzyme
MVMLARSSVSKREKGAGEIDGITHTVKDGSGVIVPYGVMHNVTNTSKTAVLKLYTIYSPAVHMDNVVRKTKQEALQRKSISTEDPRVDFCVHAHSSIIFSQNVLKPIFCLNPCYSNGMLFCP